MAIVGNNTTAGAVRRPYNTRGAHVHVGAASGSLSSIFAYVDTENTQYSLQAAIYVNNAGSPGALVATSNILADQTIDSASPQVVELTFSSPVALDGDYWFSIASSWNLFLWDDNGTGTGATDSTAVPFNPPAVWADPADITGPNSTRNPVIWADVTASSTPTISSVTGNNMEGTITINGSNLTGVTSATNGGISLTDVTVVNDSQVTATNISAGLAIGSSNDIVVTHPSNGSSTGFSSVLGPPANMEAVVLTSGGGILAGVSGLAAGDIFAHDDLLTGGYDWDVDSDGVPAIPSGIPTDVYTVNVRFYDQSDTYSVTSDTLDVTWHEVPVLGADATPTVNENQTTVGTYATTAGSTPIVYSLSGADSGLFGINSSTGAVTFNDAPDYELWVAGGSVPYEITVTASNTDNDSNPYSDAQNVSISIANVNESPVINNQTFNVLDGLTAGQAVINPVATDPEGGGLTWSFISGNEAGDWQINSDTGQITNLNTLDYATTSAYNIVTQVDDGVTTVDTGTITINIFEFAEEPRTMQKFQIFGLIQ